MSDAPSTNPPYTGMSLSSLRLELLAYIVEHSVQPNFYFMSLDAVDANNCQADCPDVPASFPFTDHAHWQTYTHQPPPPPIALTCRKLYAEWARQKGRAKSYKSLPAASVLMSTPTGTYLSSESTELIGLTTFEVRDTPPSGGR